MSRRIVTRSDFQTLAGVRVAEAESLLTSGQWSGAYYLAGYAVELGLKACVMKRIQTTDEYPAKNFTDKLYTHDLEKLFHLAKLFGEFEREMKANQSMRDAWEYVEQWSEESRYDFVTEPEARQLHRVVTTTPNGVLPWIAARW